MQERNLTIRQETRVGTGISRNQALFLLKQIWPEAPLAKQVEAAMICQQYRLNPLMRQVHLVKYDRYEYDKAQNRRIKTGEDWSVILGIGATRQIAQDEGKYSYTDGPRVLTEPEHEIYLGEIDKANLWFTTEITDRQGNKYRGFGFWPKDKEAKGAEKGNSKRNMAAIRSERDALKKYQPGRIPDLDVADEDYMPLVNVDQALIEGKQEFDAQVKQDVEDFYGDGEPVAPPSTEQPKAEASGQTETVQKLTDFDKLMMAVREVKKALRSDRNVIDWLAATLKVSSDEVKADPVKAWLGIRDLIGKAGKEL